MEVVSNRGKKTVSNIAADDKSRFANGWSFAEDARNSPSRCSASPWVSTAYVREFRVTGGT